MLIFIPNMRCTRRAAICIIVQLFIVMAALGVLLLALDAPNFLVKQADDVLHILQAYNRWYKLLAGAAVAAAALFVLGHVVLFVRLARSGELSGYNILMLLIMGGIMALMIFGIILSEDVLPLIDRSQQAIEQLEAGETTTITTWIHPNTFGPRGRSTMPGPYSSHVDQPVTGLIVRDPDGGWLYLRMPRDYALDYNESRAFDELKSIEWNNENTQSYRVTYLESFGLVLSVEQVR